ncbi:MAG: hypothetical protein ACR2N1_05375 [Rubripirellula sp.]
MTLNRPILHLLLSQSSKHSQRATGYWLLATGYWLLATGYWLLATGYWLLATGYR